MNLFNHYKFLYIFKSSELKNISFLVIIIIYFFIFLYLKSNESEFIKDYLEFQSGLNFNISSNNKQIKRKIRIGIYTVSLSDGGLQRITARLINFLDSLKIFKIYLFNQKEKEPNEYKISNNINRVVIKNKNDVQYLLKKIKKKKIDLFIYQFPNLKEIKALNNLKNTKTIFYIHSSFFYWFYTQWYLVLDIYKEYHNSKYVISIIPLENDYLFKKWGINSVFFENFPTYDYYSVIPSNLRDKKILLIGRGRNKLKRFALGIQSIEYIKIQLPDVKLMIVSKLIELDEINNCVDNLNLQKNIIFANYSSDPSIYFRDASLNFLTSISEANPLVLSETKIYGIPNIILGLDYVSSAKNGTVIIYDDSPETLAKESLKILNKNIYKKKLSRDARKSMKKFNNNNIYHDWKILLLSIINDVKNYTKYFVRKSNNSNELYNILKRQIILLNRRIPRIKNITISDIENLPNIKKNFN